MYIRSAIGASLLVVSVQAASAAVYEYSGSVLTDTVGLAPHPTGPITATVVFDDALFLADAVLDESAIISFSIESTSDALTWSSSSADFVLASFTVNSTATGFTEWGLVVEEELVSGNTGLEQVAIENGGIFGTVIDEIAFGDDLFGDKASLYEVGAFTTNSAGTWTQLSPIPLPMGGLLLLSSLGALGALLARRKSGFQGSEATAI